MTATAWKIGGGPKRRLSALRWQAAYITTLALYFFRGGTINQISGSCAAVTYLYRHIRLLRSAPHRSDGITACFAYAGGGYGAGSWIG